MQGFFSHTGKLLENIQREFSFDTLRNDFNRAIQPRRRNRVVSLHKYYNAAEKLQNELDKVNAKRDKGEITRAQARQMEQELASTNFEDDDGYFERSYINYFVTNIVI